MINNTNLAPYTETISFSTCGEMEQVLVMVPNLNLLKLLKHKSTGIGGGSRITPLKYKSN